MKENKWGVLKERYNINTVHHYLPVFKKIYYMEYGLKISGTWYLHLRMSQILEAYCKTVLDVCIQLHPLLHHPQKHIQLVAACFSPCWGVWLIAHCISSANPWISISFNYQLLIGSHCQIGQFQSIFSWLHCFYGYLVPSANFLY